jgi:hypothetical protein
LSDGTLSVETTERGGVAGNLDIRTDALVVESGATVSVSSNQGQAGNLTVNARTITLDQGTLTAETAISGANAGAVITLRGRGGISPDPLGIESPAAIETPWVESNEEEMEDLDTGDSQSSISAPQQLHAQIPGAPVLEAQGWVRDRNGQISLVTGGSHTPTQSAPISSACPSAP